MFNNVALDVVIGLILIYLLYSLFMTVIAEFISAKFGIRARILRIAIERMLNDGYYEKLETLKLSKQSAGSRPGWLNSLRYNILKWWWRWLRKVMLYEPEEFETSFAGKFYNAASIKYLSRIEKTQSKRTSQGKPSYFSAENFADTIMNVLREKGVGQTDEEKIDFCLTFNTYGIQPETLVHFLHLWETSNRSTANFKTRLMKWFDETMDRTNGWYKRKIQYVLLVLGFIVAASFNVDSIRIAKILARDNDARDAMVNMAIQLSKDSTRYKDFTRDAADSIRAKSLDSAYSHLQEDIRVADMILGLGWDFSSLQKEDYHKVARSDEKVFESVLQKRKNFQKFKDEYTSLTKSIELSASEMASAQENLLELYTDSLIQHNEKILAEGTPDKDSVMASLEATRKATGNTRVKIATIRLKIFRDSVKRASANSAVRSILDSINHHTGKKFKSLRSIEYDEKKDPKNIYVYGRTPYGFMDKTGYFLTSVFYNFFGLFITAIALSLGAPFWFDSLKKVVSIRTAGVKPEEKNASDPKIKSAVEVPAIAVSQPKVVIVKGKDIVEEALLQHGATIRSIAGVKSVFIFKDPAKGERKIQINVADAPTAAEVTRKFPSLNVGGTSLLAVIQITGVPITHNGPGVIHHRSGNNGDGSLGCVLKRNDTGSLHILSCWHVMKDLNFQTDPSRMIDDHMNVALADRWAGGIRDTVDYGIARCNSNASIISNVLLTTALGLASHTRISFRAVTQNDIDNQIEIKFLDFLPGTPTVKPGVLFTDSTEVELHYADKPRIVKDILVLTQSVTMQKAITQPGNSGAIVFDYQNKAIGMVIGGDMNFTYALKLSNVLSIHQEMSIV